MNPTLLDLALDHARHRPRATAVVDRQRRELTFAELWSLVAATGTALRVLLSPQEFLERLAAQVPPPRRHMVTYHGVLAPASGYRDQVVPADRRYREPMHRHRKTRSKPKDDAAELATADAQDEDRPDQLSKPKRRPTPWAELLMRTFGLDALHCPLCGGRRKLIALISQPHTAQRILESMRLPADPPVLAPARPPPQPTLAFAE